jgi:hypothetical protein
MNLRATAGSLKSELWMIDAPLVHQIISSKDVRAHCICQVFVIAVLSIDCDDLADHAYSVDGIA